jgi:hypothetical protein
MNLRNPTVTGVLLLLAAEASATSSATGVGQAVVPLWVWICAIAAASVFAAILYSVVAFRPGKDSNTDARDLRSAAHELVWATIPIAIVIAAAVPAMSNPAVSDRNSIAADLQGCREWRSCREALLGRTSNNSATPCASLSAAHAAATGALAQITPHCSALR